MKLRHYDHRVGCSWMGFPATAEGLQLGYSGFVLYLTGDLILIDH